MQAASIKIIKTPKLNKGYIRYNCAVTFYLSQHQVGFGSGSTMRNILESGNCIMASVSFPGKHVKHITEQGKVMTAGNSTGCLRGKGGARGAAAKLRTEKQQESMRVESGNWTPCSILLRILSHERSEKPKKQLAPITSVLLKNAL